MLNVFRLAREALRMHGYRSQYGVLKRQIKPADACHICAATNVEFMKEFLNTNS